jgi:hypothetical protein
MSLSSYSRADLQAEIEFRSILAELSVETASFEKLMRSVDAKPDYKYQVVDKVLSALQAATAMITDEE